MNETQHVCVLGRLLQRGECGLVSSPRSPHPVLGCRPLAIPARAANDPSVFTITEKAPTGAFFWCLNTVSRHEIQKKRPAPLL